MADSDPHIQPGFAGVVGPIITAEDSSGRQVRTIAPGFVPLSASGQVAGSASSPIITQPNQTVYQLASNQSLASGANTTPVTGVVGGSYLWNVIGTFAGGSTVALQALASDGATWVTIGSAVTASGNVGVVIGNNASLRLLGGVATTTNLYSSLS